MSLLVPVLRRHRKWATVLPLYDGRECPLCHAVVCGRPARREHGRWHERQDHRDEMTYEAIRVLCDRLGLQFEAVSADDERAAVDITFTDDDEGDDDDDE